MDIISLEVTHLRLHLASPSQTSNFQNSLWSVSFELPPTYLANYFLTFLKPGTPEIYGYTIHTNYLKLYKLMNIISGSDSPPSPSGIVLPDIQLPELPMRCVMWTPGSMLRAQDVHNFVNQFRGLKGVSFYYSIFFFHLRWQYIISIVLNTDYGHPMTA